MSSKPLSFSDTSIAYSYKTDYALKKSYLLFSSISNPFFSKLGTNIVKLGLKLKIPIKGIIKNTIFNQFCGGESIEKCEKTIQLLARHGIGTILDYAVESASGKLNYDLICMEILKTVDRAIDDTNIPFCVFKPSGISSVKLLEKVGQQETLSDSELSEYAQTKKRFHSIAEKCARYNVRLFIDSEHSWYQKPVDDIALQLMQSFNKEIAVVHNTYQLYRKNMLNTLKEHLQIAKKGKFILGVKLVRGAYMEIEREMAMYKRYPDPIMPVKTATDEQYNEAQKFCLENIQSISMCSGSHNETSNMLLTKWMKDKNIHPSDPRIWFAQLYGMGDNISFNLANAGYNVVKYVPYGPVKSVLPYLFRRAEENTSIVGHSSRELELIKMELKRRRT